MRTSLEEISEDALVLSADERMTLAYRLLVSVEPEVDPDIEAAWDAEISRRIERFNAGESRAIPASEVFAKLRSIAP